MTLEGFPRVCMNFLDNGKVWANNVMKHAMLRPLYFYLHVDSILSFVIADEWKKFGLYFAYYIFSGIQKRKYNESFLQLVKAFRMLIGPTVIKREVNEAEVILHNFIPKYQVLFHNMGSNCFCELLL